MNEQTSRSTLRHAKAHPVWWVIALSLAIIAVNMTLDETPVQAQNVRSAGARGIFAFTGEIATGSSGVFMVDVDAGTIWCYEYVTIKGVKRLRLVAARSWIFDRYLEEYNIEGLTPSEVEALVEQQRTRKFDTEPENLIPDDNDGL